MSKTLKLEIITPERIVFNEDVEFFSLRSTEGDLGVLPNHAPLFTSVVPCILKFKQRGQEDFVALMGGFLEVSNNQATVLADVAERAEEIDVMRARKAKERAEVELAERREHVGTAEVEASIRRAFLRLRAVELIKSHRRGMPGLRRP